MTPDESARKSYSAVLQALADPESTCNQSKLAERLGVSESTVSRLKNDQLLEILRMLAHMGFKVVPNTVRCYPADQIGAIFALAKERMAQLQSVEQLSWE